MRKWVVWLTAGVAALGLLTAVSGLAYKAIAVEDDALVRMPGTQPDETLQLEDPSNCTGCHNSNEVAKAWQGSMMAHAARDFLFWPALTVAGQDAQWATGRTSAMDVCIRCHLPKGWLEGRSDPVNATAMRDADFDGVQCDVCHRLYDPFFEDTFSGLREGSDWAGYWDESNGSPKPSQAAAQATRDADRAESQGLLHFNGLPFYGNNHLPAPARYTENAGGQMFLAKANRKRGPFADPFELHVSPNLYSRYHKSRFFCSTCHDVSNPVLVNLEHKTTAPGDGTTVLPSEEQPAHAYFHIERTFSEFMLSAFGQDGGAPGSGAFAPDVFDTSRPDNRIVSCQDCHMPTRKARGTSLGVGPLRPDDSVEHPRSGVPLHDFTGGNVFVTRVLASAVPGSPVFDDANATLLGQGPAALTADFSAGMGLDPATLLAASDRARGQLETAAALERAAFNPATGTLTFRIVNRTGHKLISGYPEGRRMFINVKAYAGDALVREINPYDAQAATLKGLPLDHSPNSPALAAHEEHRDDLVYEVHQASALLDGERTFHMALATDRIKDNRIPPKGFRIAEAAARLSQPVWNGSPDPEYFTSAEYAGGYDEVTAALPPTTDRVEIRLYYQTTSREYMEFLRDEINGTGRITLPESAYIVQTDPFFAKLKAWGGTVWELWEHNKDLPGAAPVLMTQAVVTGSSGPDVNGDGSTDAVDVQTVVNAVLGLDIGGLDADVNSDGATDAVDVQAVVNAVLGVL